MSVSLGERMKYLLKKKKISQRQLADKCGISEQTISRYIRGTRFPGSIELFNMADALGVSADYLFGREPSAMSVDDLITRLGVLSNDMTLSVNECLEYHRAKLIVEKVYKKYKK